MTRWARMVFVSALGLWVGGMATVGFIVAPTVFRTVPSRLQAGTIFGAVLHNFGTQQIILAVVCLASLVALRLAGGLSNRRAAFRIGGVGVMLALVLVSQYYLSPEIVRERESIAAFDSVPAGTPRKARFDRLHRTSVQLAGATLLIGVVLLVCSTLTPKAPDGA
jgi:uncharacterized membrane protein